MTAAEPIRLTFLVNCFDLSGVETIIARTIAGLDRRRYRIRVIALQGRGGAFARLLESMGVECVDLGMRSRADVGALVRLGRMLHDVDVLHTATFHSHIIGRILGRLRRVPVIFGAEVIMDFESSLRHLLNRLTAGIPDVLICNSEAVRQYVVDKFDVPPEKTLTVYQGVDIRRYPPRRPVGSAPVVGTVGRLAEQKGYDSLVRAAARLKPANPDLRWVCIGEGPERSRIERDMEANDVTDVVKLAGYCGDMPANLARFDFYVQPSNAEGLSYATLEAMATGLPVVATDVGGTRELVLHGETGLLVPPRDPAALAAALGELIADPDRAARLGANARDLVATRFSEEGMAAAEDSLIRRHLR